MRNKPDTSSGEKTSPRMAVIRAIKRWIADGALSPGEALPSERVLSERLGVQRPTIRRALRILEGEGIIRTVSPRTRIVAEQTRLMEHALVVISPPVPPQELAHKHEPGWSVIMLDSVHRAVVAGGYNLMLVHPDRVTPDHLQRVISGRPSGVILPELVQAMPTAHVQWIESIRSAGIPVAAFGDAEELQTFDRVVSDHEAGAYDLTRLLIDRGCRRPLMLFTPGTTHYWVRQRRAGYERAMEESGLVPLPLVTCGPAHAPPAVGLGTAEAFDAVRRHYAGYLMDYLGPLARHDRIDAVLAASDGDTFGIAAACRTLGCEPGRDIKIVGYDNYYRECPESAYEPSKPLATVDQHNPRIGTELVRLVMDREAGTLPPQPVMRHVKPDLILIE